MRALWERNKLDIVTFGVLFGALLLRISWFGPEYAMQLDDYIHYRDYPAGTDFLQLCIDRGLFASRPLAAISDFLVWKPLPRYLASVLLCAMYAGAVMLYGRLFRKYFSAGAVFLVVFALLPTGFEGTYWHAAATRILPPLLFGALALTALDRFWESGGWGKLAAYLLWGLLSFCFYEQMLVLSLTLCLLLSLMQLFRGNRRGAWGFLIFLPVLVYVLGTGYFAGLNTGVLSSRMNLMLPTDEGYFTDLLPKLLDQLQSCWVEGTLAIFGRGFVRGLRWLTGEGLWALLPAAALCWALAGLDSGADRSQGLLFGFLAALAPMTPFFLLANPWFGLRNLVPSFLGLALLADVLVRRVLKHRSGALAAVLAAVCMVVSVSELSDYRTVAAQNETVARAILDADEDWSGRIGILGLNQSNHPDQNFRYHDHVASAHVSDWGLTGLLRYYSGGAELHYRPVPLPTDEEYYWNDWNKAVRDVTAYDALYFYDHALGTLEPLTVRAGEGEWLLLFSDGSLCARIWEDAQGLGYLEIS